MCEVIVSEGGQPCGFASETNRIHNGHLTACHRGKVSCSVCKRVFADDELYEQHKSAKECSKKRSRVFVPGEQAYLEAMRQEEATRRLEREKIVQKAAESEALLNLLYTPVVDDDSAGEGLYMMGYRRKDNDDADEDMGDHVPGDEVFMREEMEASYFTSLSTPEDDAAKCVHERFVTHEQLVVGYCAWEKKMIEDRECTLALSTMMDLPGAATVERYQAIENLYRDVIVPNSLQTQAQKDLHQWIYDNAPGLVPEAFAEFTRARLSFEQCTKFVKVLVMTNPPINCFVIPITEVARPDMASDRLICQVPALVPKLDPVTNMLLHYVDGYLHTKRFADLCDYFKGARFIASQVFADEMRLTKRNSRQMHGVYWRVMNVAEEERGDWQLVSMVPQFSDSDGAEHGLSIADCVLVRRMLMHQTLDVLFMYAGVEIGQSPTIVRLSSGRDVECWSVVSSIVADGKAVNELHGRPTITNTSIAPDNACFRCGPVHANELHETKKWPTIHHNEEYKELRRQLLCEALDTGTDKETREAKKKAKTDSQRFGFLLLLPAYFHLAHFNGAEDILEDLQHVNPAGIGKNLMTYFSAAILTVLPLSNAVMKCTTAVNTSAIHHLSLEVGDQVELIDAPKGAMFDHATHTYCRLKLLVEVSEGFVPLSSLKKKTAANVSSIRFNERFDAALQQTSNAYIKGYDKFDANCCRKMSDYDGGGGLGEGFSRATTAELVLLYMPRMIAELLLEEAGVLCLPEKSSLLRKGRWIIDTLEAYNKYYWNLRRASLFESEAAVVRDQAILVQDLLNNHFMRFSKVDNNTMKHHGMQHLAMNAEKHGGSNITSTGAGDHAHLSTKARFMASSKTRMQEALHEEMLANGPKPCFIVPAKHVAGLKPPGVVGEGTLTTWRSLVVALQKELAIEGWDLQILNAPGVAVGKYIRDTVRASQSSAVDYNDFMASSCRVHHSLILPDGLSKVYGSSLFKNCERRDFVELTNGDGPSILARVMAIVQFQEPGVWGKSVQKVIVEICVAEERSIFHELFGWRIFSEGSEWLVLDIAQIVRPVSAQPSVLDNRFHSVLPDKHEPRIRL